MIWHNAAYAHNGTIKQCEQIPLAVFREKQKTWFCRRRKNQNAEKRI